MNPQYFSHQQYGAPPQKFVNDGQNNQDFENVPLVPSSSHTPSNVPPTSVSLSSQSSQLNNLLGKMPSGNLGPFTVLPQGQNISGLDTRNQNVDKTVDGIGAKSVANNNIVSGPPRTSQTLNGTSQNDLKTSPFSIPPSQLPPSNLQSKPQAPPLSQLPPSSASSFEHRSSPIMTQNINFPPSSQPSQASPFQPVSLQNPSQSANNLMSPQMSSKTYQNQGSAPPSVQSPSVPTGTEQQIATSQFNTVSNRPSIGKESNNPFMQSPPMEPTRSVRPEQVPTGIQQNSGSSPNLPPPLKNQPTPVNPQMFGASGQQDQGLYGQHPPMGQPSMFSQQQSNQGSLPMRPISSSQSQTSNQQLSQGQQSLQGQSQFPGQPPLPGQNQFTGRSPVPGKLAGNSGLSEKLHSQDSLSGPPPTSGHLPGPPPLSGQLSRPPTMSGQIPEQQTLPNQQLSGQPPLPGQLPMQPPLPGQLPGQASLPGQQSSGQQFPGQRALPGQLLPGQHSSPGQQFLPGQNSSLPGQQMPGQNSLPGQQLPGQNSLPGQLPPTGQSQMSKQNLYGRPPLPGQTGSLPPMPSNQSFPSSAPGLMQGQQSFNQHTRGNNSYGPSGNQSPMYQQQLSNQMQNMNVSGSKQFSGLPPLGPTNGDNGPHMPPPLNGQQMKSPSGYPPMPNQPSAAPGYPPQPGFPPQQGYPQQPPYPQQGYPQQPGYPQHGYPQAGYQQQNQQKRLDPDQMPSPIQVTTDDQNNRSGVFATNQKGLMPPLVTTNFVVQDQGNCSPRFIRSTMYNVAITSDMMKNTAVPFSLVISPLARLAPGEYSPPIVNFGELGPVRCVRCKAYMCPYMTFVDSGRRFQCAFCKATSDVPAEYFQHLDHTGQRMDRFERPELVLGTYEFMATADYCKTNVLPQVPAVIFIIDVSYNCIKSGLVRLLCSQMKEIIRNLPIDEGQEVSKMRVGFITYDNTVHFYNIKGTLAAPQMLVVGDTHEMFMPLLDGFLSTPEESEAIIDALMEQIPNMFGGTRQTETILLPAILAGVEALKASGCAGKLIVFSSNLPTVDAPGKLKNRDDRKLLGTDKERTILTPQNKTYNELGQECVQAGVSVDLFLFNNSYIDVATIGQVSRISGGEVFKYTYFQADLDGERLIQDIITDISRPIAFDAIMRVRTSTGVRPTEFYGHFFMSNTTDMELGAIDCDKAVAVEIKHDDKLHEEDGVYIQAALLYTSCSGQRRLRICNLSLKTCAQMTDLYRSCDLDTLINYWSKQALSKLMDNNPKAIKDGIVSRAAQVLATYRKNCASPSSAGQLILPECMKLLPLYVNCLLKNDALSGGSDMTVDERSFVMQACMTMDVPTSVFFFYPRLIPIHDLDTNSREIPQPIRCSIEKMTEQGVYILENGIHMFMWIGLGANPDFIQKLFGVPSVIQVNIEQFKLPELDNSVSAAVRHIIEEIRIQRHRHMRLTLVRQREKIEPVFKHFLVEDKGIDGSPSYVDFLCHMHKEIRSLLS